MKYILLSFWDAAYWYDLGEKEINEALDKQILSNVAKNVILFLGDGEYIYIFFSTCLISCVGFTYSPLRNPFRFD